MVDESHESDEMKKYAELLRYWPGGSMIVGDGVVLAANDDAVAVTGIPRDRLVGTPLAELLLPDFVSLWTDALNGAGPETTSVPVRLARAFAPLELSIRKQPDSFSVVHVRSMAIEYHFSAKACAELTHDQVTGFPNRFQVLAQLHDRIVDPKNTPLAILGLWIDELPELAASHGEPAVERIVWEVGQRIQGRLRGPDVLGRLDGAGFLTLLVSDAEPAQLTEIADRLREEVSFPVEFKGNLVSFTASVAVASLNHPRPSVAQALAKLDAAAKRAVTGTGNRTEVLDFTGGASNTA